MNCLVGNDRKDRLEDATLAVGRYAESLHGVPRLYEHHVQKEQLARQMLTAVSAYLEHKERCVECQQ